MKTPKTIAKRYKINCNWEKYTPSCQKGQKSVLWHTFLYIKKYFFPCLPRLHKITEMLLDLQKLCPKK